MRVLLASPWIPPEWVRAHQLEAGAIWCEDGFARSATPLAAGVCLFAERVVRYAEARPECAVVFATSCDQLRRGFDAATEGGPGHSFLFNLPATQTATAKRIYRAELERLGHFLASLGGSGPTPAALRREMRQAAEARRGLQAAAPASAARPFAQAVEQFQRDGSISLPALATAGNEAPLALVGGPFCPPHWPLLEVIERAGGRVVLNATETGERSLAMEYNQEEDEPFEALVNGCFQGIVDAFQRPNTRLYAWLKRRFLARAVRGVVLWHFTGCDLWRAEAETLREVTRLPVLLLEAGEAEGVSRQQVNRIEAFVETLR
jgi:benzoyl-CoA reductase/2-hydroxyglutaryl-CoA dehydratase subunit BcrC/BadD/HgdB